MKNNITLGGLISWIVLYFGILLFSTLLDIMIWRKRFPKSAQFLQLLTLSLCSMAFLFLLFRSGYGVPVFDGLSPSGILLSLGCSFLFFLILDQGLDPCLERLFPQSQNGYAESVQRLMSAPAAGFFHACFLAPVMEEFLMRGLLLGGLQSLTGTAAALLISSLLFALLHFNMVQTLSALVCGLVLGLLYLHTGCLFCCMLAHCVYNLLSCLVLIRSSTIS